MSAKRRVRNIIEMYERGEPLGDELYALERDILLLTGRFEGSTQAANQTFEEVGTYTAGKLEATEKHLHDMRRLVMLENEKGEVS